MNKAELTRIEKQAFVGTPLTSLLKLSIAALEVAVNVFIKLHVVDERRGPDWAKKPLIGGRLDGETGGQSWNLSLI